MGLPKEEIEPLVRWLLTNNQSQIADYCNDKGFVSVAETTADSDKDSIDGILMDDEDELPAQQKNFALEKTAVIVHM